MFYVCMFRERERERECGWVHDGMFTNLLCMYVFVNAGMVLDVETDIHFDDEVLHSGIN